MTAPRELTRAIYAYKADHVIRAALLVSLAFNAGLVLLVWVLIGLLRVWR